MWSTIRPATARATTTATARVGGRAAAAAASSVPAPRWSCGVTFSRATPFRTGRVRYQWDSAPARGFATSARAAAAVVAAGGKKTAAAATKNKTTTKKSTKTAAAKKKKKPVGRPKKVEATKRGRPAKALTPEQETKNEIKELKKEALLDRPKLLPDRPWLIYVTERVKGHSVGTAGIGSAMSELSQSFKALSTSEIKHLEEAAEKNKLANNAAYKAWVESHPAGDIAEANRARARLNKLAPSRRHAPIADDRQPKRPLNAFSFFTKARWASGEFAGRPLGEVSKVMAVEWRDLPSSQRQVYEDLAKSDFERYEKEMQSVLGRTVRSTKSA